MPVDAEFPDVRRRRVGALRRALRDFFADTGDDVVDAFFLGAELGDVFDTSRLSRELRRLLLGINRDTAHEIAERVVAGLEADLADWDPDVQEPWLRENARVSGENIVDAAGESLEVALGDDRPLAAIRDLFNADLGETRAPVYATGIVTAVGMFAAQDAARAVGSGTKTWQVNSGNPRSEHAALDGETVPIDEAFSNGLMWPGDPTGDADQVAGCQCSVVFN